MITIQQKTEKAYDLIEELFNLAVGVADTEAKKYVQRVARDFISSLPRYKEDMDYILNPAQSELQ